MIGSRGVMGSKGISEITGFILDLDVELVGAGRSCLRIKVVNNGFTSFAGLWSCDLKSYGTIKDGPFEDDRHEFMT